MTYNLLTSTQANYGGEVKTAQEWREFIASGRGRLQRKAANNTLVIAGYGDDNAVAIRLHDTNIVIVNNDGTFTLDSGGWRTVTTKERINRYTPAGISQRGGVWYMADGSLFYDGMTIKADGTPVKPRKTAAYEKRLKTIKKQAKEYARAYVKALQAGAVDYPNGGDCWYCLMFDKGNAGASADHIRQHIKERYFVPSLLVNAGRAAGYRDDQIGLMGIGGQRVFIEPERVLYRYIVKRLQAEL